jgi:hypothetical protein
MSMTVKIKWAKAVSLGPKAGFLDRLTRNSEQILETIPDEPGIYVFARKFGSIIEPMYVGRALNLRLRIKTQFNNLKLMGAIGKPKSLNGVRVLLVGAIKKQPGLKLSEAIKVAEQGHIEHALTAGCPLLNIQGTRTLKHAIEVVPPKAQNHPFPGLMYLTAHKKIPKKRR